MWQTGLKRHWLWAEAVGGDFDNECAEDTCLQWWGREEEWSCTGSPNTVSFWMRWPNSRDVLTAFQKAQERSFPLECVPLWFLCWVCLCRCLLVWMNLTGVLWDLFVSGDLVIVCFKKMLFMLVFERVKHREMFFCHARSQNLNINIPLSLPLEAHALSFLISRAEYTWASQFRNVLRQHECSLFSLQMVPPLNSLTVKGANQSQHRRTTRGHADL